MYNRILKRPMFRRGGMGYSAQGTGITSGMDTPRPRYYGGGTIGGGMIHGNPMGYRTGFEEPKTKEDIRTEISEVVATPKGQYWDDVISSFGAYSNPYKADGTAKTIGEMGWEQAQSINQIRKDRKDKQDLAKISGLEGELEDLTTQETQAHEMKKLDFKKASDLEVVTLTAQLDKDTKLAVEEAKGNNLDIIRRISLLDERLANDKITQAQYDDAVNSLLTKSDTIMESARDLAQALISAGMVTNEEEALTKAIVLITGLKKILYKATGGRVGYQMGTPNTGAMPVEQASITETIDTPGADMTATETITEQQPTVQMPYEEFRAAIPPEVNDAIVQLIYYNQDAFADFSQITTQSDVYAFNNKYGVSLVLPMDTETT